MGPGKTPAFSAVFAELREPVFKLAVHVTGNRAEAEDVTQETFLAVHRALPTFRGEAQLSTWVYRIALRAALRARARRRPADELRVEYEPASGPLEDAVGARLEVQRLARAMEQLPTEQRAVLSLFAVDGLSHAQVAEVLGVPEGTVWSRLHVARKRLAELMGPR